MNTCIDSNESLVDLRHLRPASRVGLFSSVLKGVALEDTAAIRSFSLDELAPVIFWRAWFQGIGSLR